MALAAQVGDRWSVIGATGSGKTWLSRDLIRFYVNGTGGRVPVVIFDTKMAGDFNDFIRRKDITTVIQGNDPEKVHTLMYKKPITVWQPERDDTEDYEEYFRLIYQTGRHKKSPAITYIDELSSITHQNGKAPDHYDILLKQGRGMNLGVISVTQSPSFIPSNLLRQTTHAIRMRLNDDYDLKKLARIMGNEVLNEPPHDFGFFYRDCTKPKAKQPPIYFTDKDSFFGK